MFFGISLASGSQFSYINPITWMDTTFNIISNAVIYNKKFALLNSYMVQTIQRITEEVRVHIELEKLIFKTVCLGGT